MHFQDIILKLQDFWKNQGAVLLQPMDLEIGAATFHPETFFRSLGNVNSKESGNGKFSAAFVQNCRRPGDGRYGENPNRIQKFHQFQVILKPSPENIREISIESFRALGVDLNVNEIQFIEDNWESPTLGASGVGWEVRLNGMEVLQYTYFQQVAGHKCEPVMVELAYGVERLAMNLQGKESLLDLKWNSDVLYRDLFLESEKQHSCYNFEGADIDFYFKLFDFYIEEGLKMTGNDLYIVAYESAVKASHVFNMIEARGGISHIQRTQYIKKIKDLCKICADIYLRLKGVLS